MQASGRRRETETLGGCNVWCGLTRATLIVFHSREERENETHSSAIPYPRSRFPATPSGGTIPVVLRPRSPLSYNLITRKAARRENAGGTAGSRSDIY